MAFRISVSGSFACFKRPEFSHDLVTYDVPTPMAARGLFEAVHWTPAISWRIDSIIVLDTPVMQWISFAALETIVRQVDPPPRIFGGRHDDRQVCLLTNVAYVITAHFEMTVKGGPVDSAAQHASMFKRRLKQGRFFKPPYLGIPGLAATIGQVESDAAPNVDAAMAGHRDLGWMLHDVHRDGVEGARFFRAVMRDGVIDLTTDESRLLAG